jgi:hypothetical protein
MALFKVGLVNPLPTVIKKRTLTSQSKKRSHKLAVVGKSIMQIDNRWIDAHRITI